MTALYAGSLGSVLESGIPPEMVAVKLPAAPGHMHRLASRTAASIPAVRRLQQWAGRTPYIRRRPPRREVGCTRREVGCTGTGIFFELPRPGDRRGRKLQFEILIGLAMAVVPDSDLPGPRFHELTGAGGIVYRLVFAGCPGRVSMRHPPS